MVEKTKEELDKKTNSNVVTPLTEKTRGERFTIQKINSFNRDQHHIQQGIYSKTKGWINKSLYLNSNKDETFLQDLYNTLTTYIKDNNIVFNEDKTQDE